MGKLEKQNQMTDNKNFFGSIDNVVLKEYDPNYPVIFEKEIELLKRILLNRKANYHHIGSTAIPDILSKPIVDIAIELDKFPLSEQEIDKISELGYRYWKSNPNPDHQFFFKNLPRTHHLHFYPQGYQKLIDQIRFRDILNIDEKLRAEYEELKIQLAEKHKLDREKYTNEKIQFIKKVLEQ